MISPLVRLRRQPQENHGWLPTARLRVSMPEPYHAISAQTSKHSLCSGFSICFLYPFILSCLEISFTISPLQILQSPFGGPPVLKILRVKLQEWLPAGRMEQAPDKNSSHQCQSSLQKRLRKYERWSSTVHSKTNITSHYQQRSSGEFSEFC